MCTFVADGRVEEERLLRNEDNAMPQRCIVHFPQVDIGNQHVALGRIGESGEQSGQRRLFRAGGSDDGDVRPGFEVERDFTQG
jgi:hypothetical protein